jgi:hypothetical protein
MTLSSASDVEVALARVGELLRFRRQSFAIAIVGGAALNLIGAVSRTTTDVDVLAVANPLELARNARSTLTEAPNPLPVDLIRAAADVARDLNLDEGWLNSGPTLQMRAGLPPGMESRFFWRQFGSLWVGIPAREDLIALKLFAAVDRSGPGGVDTKDLIALAPTAAELEWATEWVATQDASPAFASTLAMVRQFLLSTIPRGDAHA